MALAATLPVDRQRCAHFTTVLTLTPNSRAAARHDQPAPTAAITRSRKSNE
jgi:hypothetical protein